MSFLECIDALLEVDILRGKLRLNSYQSGTVSSSHGYPDLLSCLTEAFFHKLLSSLRKW